MTILKLKKVDMQLKCKTLLVIVVILITNSQSICQTLNIIGEDLVIPRESYPYSADLSGYSGDESCVSYRWFELTNGVFAQDSRVIGKDIKVVWLGTGKLGVVAFHEGNTANCPSLNISKIIDINIDCEPVEITYQLNCALGIITATRPDNGIYRWADGLESLSRIVNHGETIALIRNTGRCFGIEIPFTVDQTLLNSDCLKCRDAYVSKCVSQ